MRRALVPLLILLLGVGAPALSTWLYFSGAPLGQAGFGTLIKPTPLPAKMTVADGSALEAGTFNGKWVIAQIADAACPGESCRRKLCLMRFLSQSRPEAEFRTERLFWARGSSPIPASIPVRPDCGLGFERLASERGPIDMLANVYVVRFDPHIKEWARNVAGPHPERFIFLIDPKGNLMMRYDESADPYRMAKSFARLLRLSRGI